MSENLSAKLLKSNTPFYILLIFVAVNLGVGILIAPDFGRSTDEAHEYRTAQVAMSIYSGKIDKPPAEKFAQLGHDQYYGTATTSLIYFVENLLIPDAKSSNKVIAHFVYFVIFQVAVVGVFLLARKFFDGWVSLSVAILFGAQPLLFGHAFINPKDIPLLTTFLFSVLTGFSMVDRWPNQNSVEGEQGQENHGQKELKGLKSRRRLLLVIFIFLFLILWFKPWISELFLDFVEYSYNTRGASLAGGIFTYLTTEGSLEGYLTLANLALTDIYCGLSFGIPILLFFIFFVAQRHRLFGKKINLSLLLAAAVWGFAISTRVLAVAAGGMVGIYALIKFREKAITPLIVYTMSASIFSYITWPFLWVYGFKGYFESLTLITNFPWHGQVLFEGQFFDPTELPARYLPKLMMLQFTEPFLILALIGFLVSFFMLFRRQTETNKLIILFAWFFVPLLYTMIRNPTLYSNFRHFLFITPVLFIIAGFPLQYVASRVRHSAIVFCICLLMVLPGGFAMVQIHPFEYMYYNAFIGGIPGAHTEYEMDYWGLAYKNAMDYVNEHIPSGAQILVWKDSLYGKAYAKHAYVFAAHTSVEEHEYHNFDYMIMPTDHLAGHSYFADFPVEHSVEIANVSLVVILKLRSEVSSSDLGDSQPSPAITELALSQ